MMIFSFKNIDYNINTTIIYWQKIKPKSALSEPMILAEKINETYKYEKIYT